jgi:hypothetical protein
MVTLLQRRMVAKVETDVVDSPREGASNGAHNFRCGTAGAIPQRNADRRCGRSALDRICRDKSAFPAGRGQQIGASPGHAQKGGWFAFARRCPALLAFPDALVHQFRWSAGLRPGAETFHRNVSTKRFVNNMLRKSTPAIRRDYCGTSVAFQCGFGAPLVRRRGDIRGIWEFLRLPPPSAAWLRGRAPSSKLGKAPEGWRTPRRWREISNISFWRSSAFYRLSGGVRLIRPIYPIRPMKTSNIQCQKW